MTQSTRSNAGSMGRWLACLGLAAALTFGAQILLWDLPLERPLIDWAVIVFGNIVLAVLLLDVLVRYRVRDLFGVVTVAGVYALLSSLLIHPATSYADLPRTLITRVTGASALVALEMLLLFLVLFGARLRSLPLTRLLGGLTGLIVGIAWGFWGRWAPVFNETALVAPSLEVLLLAGALGLTLIIVLTVLAVRRASGLQPGDFLLGIRGLSLMALALTGLGFWQLVQNALTGEALLIAGLLLALLFAILWFRRSTRLPTLMETLLPPSLRGLSIVAIALVNFFIAAAFAYSLPLIGSEALNQYVIIVYGFALFGIGWLPLISMILGARAYVRQVQSTPM